MRKVFLFLGVLAIPIAAWPQSDPRPEILVLGTYHMANPGRDVHNMQADDVLSPRRQQEIAQLIEVLKRFHPTKIAIEAAVGSKRAGQEYSDYLAGKYTLSRNEIDQVHTGWPRSLAITRSTRSMRTVISLINGWSIMRRPMVSQRSSTRWRPARARG